MADKLTQLTLDALTRAAADPTGVPLFGSKAGPGLFPPSAAAKSVAKRCLDDGLLHLLRTEPAGKQSREVCGVTDAGLRFLLDRVSPKQVLEDFVRVLEDRRGQVDELLSTARRMADDLAGLRATVAAVLPRVSHAANGHAHMNGVATLPAPPSADADDLAGAVLTHLADWAASAGAGQDCPLPDLYRAVAVREAAPTIGTFHDCLRRLHAARQVYLHPWTGPLYTLPEPAYALLVGHEIAYYASACAPA